MFGNSHFQNHYYNGQPYLKISKDNSPSHTLICLHGMFGGLSNYDGLVPHMDNCELFVPSLPIHGDSGERPTIRGLSNWLDQFISDMNLEEPILMGNSLGGHLALDYVIQHPKKVRALVLTGSSGLQEKEFGSTCPRRNDREYIRAQAAQTFYKDLVDDALLDDIMEVITTPEKLKNVLAIARDTYEHQIEQQLPEILQPVLLIWGRNDQITPPEVANKFEQMLPKARLRWIDKCGHAPMMEHPETFALFLNEFLIELQNQPKTKKKSTDYEENYSHL
jgi:pimeloyl-ACP methyl ester carboxylesterase